ncbi:uncharacterized protein LOC143249014 isoform X1 [Tachypleus tridentatus]|uniref:uncharacterized protein LOC143249014 isoform X1 n=1 Tax=Tachypleus tridentatus TaxID=6853 RepID=UPI003FD56DEB
MGEVNLVASSMVKMDTSHKTVKILTEKLDVMEEEGTEFTLHKPGYYSRFSHTGFSDHDTNWTTFLYHLELQQQGRTNSWFMELEKLIFHLKRVKHHPLVKKLAVCQRTQVS